VLRYSHSQAHSSDSEEEGQQELSSHDLTAIAGGQTGGGLSKHSVTTATGDFFGEAELAGLGVSDLVSLDGGLLSLEREGQQLATAQETWVLPTEAFEQRHELKDSLRGEQQHGGYTPMGQEGDTEGEGGQHSQLQTVTVEDKTSAVVVWGVHAEEKRAAWSPLGVTRDTLTWLAEHGDVQNAVSMYIVLVGDRHLSRHQDRLKGFLPPATIEHWWQEYIYLLQRLSLFTQANEILSLCTLPKIHDMNGKSTTVYTSCTRCGKLLGKSGGAWWCDRCKAPPARCVLCHAVVKGLFVWCQGCSHGGHIKCLSEWLKKKSNCPSGCGHLCQYH